MTERDRPRGGLSDRVAGRSLVRIATSDGIFDFPIMLDISVEEFPF